MSANHCAGYYQRSYDLLEELRTISSMEDFTFAEFELLLRLKGVGDDLTDEEFKILENKIALKV